MGRRVDEKLPPSLQESLLAVLAYDDTDGAVVAAQVKPENFDSSLVDVVERILRYRSEHGRAPGPTHLDDLFEELVPDPKSSRASKLRRLFLGLSELREGLNAPYIASRVQDFLRAQTYKAAITNAGNRFLQGGDNMLVEVEGILTEALRFRAQTMDAGVRLSDPKGIEAMFATAAMGCSLGIPELDDLNIGLSEKELLLYVGPKGSGKTWLCVHGGRRGLQANKKVLHISLEVRWEIVFRRYQQNLFSVAHRRDQVPDRMALEFDKLGRLIGFRRQRLKPDIALDDTKAFKALRKQQQLWGTRLDNLVLKDFPSGTLTMRQLIGYLDYLETAQRFVPNILIVDYPDLMKHEHKGELRHQLRQTFVDLRGLAVERNMAVLAPTQVHRAGLNAKRVRGSMVGEDVTKLFTADNVLTYSKTEDEDRMGLARLHVEYARNSQAGRTIVLSQSYATGQYVLQSAAMDMKYWERLQEIAPGAGTE